MLNTIVMAAIIILVTVLGAGLYRVMKDGTPATDEDIRRDIERNTLYQADMAYKRLNK